MQFELVGFFVFFSAHFPLGRFGYVQGVAIQAVMDVCFVGVHNRWIAAHDFEYVFYRANSNDPFCLFNVLAAVTSVRRYPGHSMVLTFFQ